MLSHMSEQIEFLIFTKQIFADILISVPGSRPSQISVSTQVCTETPPWAAFPSPLPTSLCRFSFISSSYQLFLLQFSDTMSPKWRVMDGSLRVFQVSKHPSWLLGSNDIIFDWHVFTTSIFLYINGLLITLNLLAVMQMLIGINIKHQTDTISTEQTQSVYILWEL